MLGLGGLRVDPGAPGGARRSPGDLPRALVPGAKNQKATFVAGLFLAAQFTVVALKARIQILLISSWGRTESHDLTLQLVSGVDFS